MAARLPTRQLGHDGPQVSALGFGAMGLSGESLSVMNGGQGRDGLMMYG